jgi:O-acetylserine/cysteine efflux transporter
VTRRDILIATVVAAVWGLNFVVIEVGLRELPPLLFAALRFTLVAFPAVLFVRRPKVPARLVVLVGLFLGVGQFGLLFVGMDLGVPAGLASLVLQCQAMFALGLAAAVLGERPTGRQLAGCAVAFAGIALIATGRAAGVSLAGLALCVAAAASWGASNVTTRIARPPDALALLVWASLVPPLPLAALSLTFEGPHAIGDAFAGVGPAGIFALLYVVLGATLFGFGTWTALLRRHPAGVVAPFSLLVPVFGLLSAALLLGETPNAAELAGAAVVLAGLVLTNLRRVARRSRTPLKSANAACHPADVRARPAPAGGGAR